MDTYNKICTTFFLHLLASACVLCTGLDSKAYYLFYTKSGRTYCNAQFNQFLQIDTYNKFALHFFPISLLLHVYCVLALTPRLIIYYIRSLKFIGRTYCNACFIQLVQVSFYRWTLTTKLLYIFFLHLLASACVFCTGLDSKACYVIYCIRSLKSIGRTYHNACVFQLHPLPMHTRVHRYLY